MKAEIVSSKYVHVEDIDFKYAKYLKSGDYLTYMGKEFTVKYPDFDFDRNTLYIVTTQ